MNDASIGLKTQQENGERDDGSDGDDMTRGLWGLDWRRDVTKEGKSMLVTTLDNEGEYERFMKRFDVEDLQEVGENGQLSQVEVQIFEVV